MGFYPAASLNPNFPAIRVTGGHAFEAEVERILRHIHVGARSRAGAFIVDSILLNGDGREGLRIHPRHHAPHDHNAVTSARGAVHRSDQPHSTPADLLANPGRGAGATIAYDPFEWPQIGAGLPGDGRDEVLLHEMVHVYMIQRGLSSVRQLHQANLARRVRRFDMVDDFFAIMVTNVYASECGRPRLLDHRMPSIQLNRNAMSVRSDPRFQPFFTALANHAPGLVAEMRRIDTPFNPWHPRMELIDVTAAFNDP